MWAILTGGNLFGLTLFRQDEGIDSGKIIYQNWFELAEPTASLVGISMRDLYAEVARWVVAWARSGYSTCGPKYPNKVIFGVDKIYPRRTPADSEITQIMSVEDVKRLVRACLPDYPPFLYLNGRKFFARLLDSETQLPQYNVKKSDVISMMFACSNELEVLITKANK